MLSRIQNYICRDLAVDLGTANTRIGLPGEGLVLDEPSVVALAAESNRTLRGSCAVGSLAKQLDGRTAQSIRIVHPLRDGVVADGEFCEALLASFFRQAQLRRVPIGPRVVLTASSSLTKVERQALYLSCQRAGARGVFLLRKCQAAALGAGLPITEPQANMICDLGAGTTEAAVFSMSDVVSSQAVRVGGNGMDQAFVDYLRRRHSLKIGLPAAERLRIELGSASPLARERQEEVRGLDVTSGLPCKRSICTDEIREALAAPLEKILDCLTATIESCPAELAGDLCDRGLVLVGGGSLLRGLDRLISERIGLPVRLAENARTAALEGALLCLENFAQWRGTLETSHAAA